MKAVVKYRIEAIDYYSGKKIKFNKTITIDGINFSDKKTESISVNGGKYTLPSILISAKAQADKWLENQSELLDNIIHDISRELHVILNWEVISIKNFNEYNAENQLISFTPEQPKRPKLEVIIDEFKAIDISPELIDNIKHVYSEISESLKGLSTDRQLKILFAATGIGFKASSEAYRRMSAIIDGKNPDVIPVLETSNEKKLI